MKYASILSKVVKIIQEDDKKNWIIIGDNSIGKSELLRKVVEKKKSDIYYIDSVNRGFNINILNLSDDTFVYRIKSKEIISERVKEGIYNLTDSFGKNDHIERIYPLYKKKLKELLSEFLKIDISIKREKLEEGFGEGEIKVIIDNQNVELSSGYQAIIRIFSEIIFFNDYLKEKGTIVIDEIDEFLSPKNSSNILNFLINKFPQNNFIVSTHSGDLIANSNNAGIITLAKGTFSVLDSKDFDTLTEVNTLFHQVFQQKEENKDKEINDVLHKLYDLKVINKWTDEEENEFEKIQFNLLTPVQQLIYKRIKEW